MRAFGTAIPHIDSGFMTTEHLHFEVSYAGEGSDSDDEVIMVDAIWACPGGMVSSAPSTDGAEKFRNMCAIRQHRKHQSYSSLILRNSQNGRQKRAMKLPFGGGWFGRLHVITSQLMGVPF